MHFVHVGHEKNITMGSALNLHQLGLPMVIFSGGWHMNKHTPLNNVT